MTAMEGVDILARDDGMLGALLGRLPRSVRFLGACRRSRSGMYEAEGMCEFEVVGGNAAYREGERFYLTPAQARRAYPSVPLT